MPLNADDAAVVCTHPLQHVGGHVVDVYIAIEASGGDLLWSRAVKFTAQDAPDSNKELEKPAASTPSVCGLRTPTIFKNKTTDE